MGWSRLLALSLGISAFAERCPACGGTSDAGFCHGCAGELARVRAPCRVCALPSPVRRCPRGLLRWRVARTSAPFVYAPPLDGHLQVLKFGNGRLLGRALALLLAAELESAASPHRPDPELVVPVPLPSPRLRARGYNQAAEIARALAAELGIGFAPGAARRPGPHTAQSRLGARARIANVAEAFSTGDGVRGRRVLVVDDVITTGATINALAAALLRAGAARVDAAAVARTAAPPAGPRQPGGTVRKT